MWPRRLTRSSARPSHQNRAACDQDAAASTPTTATTPRKGFGDAMQRLLRLRVSADNVLQPGSPAAVAAAGPLSLPGRSLQTARSLTHADFERPLSTDPSHAARDGGGGGDGGGFPRTPGGSKARSVKSLWGKLGSGMKSGCKGATTPRSNGASVAASTETASDKSTTPATLPCPVFDNCGEGGAAHADSPTADGAAASPLLFNPAAAALPALGTPTLQLAHQASAGDDAAASCCSESFYSYSAGSSPFVPPGAGCDATLDLRQVGGGHAWGNMPADPCQHTFYPLQPPISLCTPRCLAAVP
jgi:hypothetical protein